MKFSGLLIINALLAMTTKFGNFGVKNISVRNGQPQTFEPKYIRI